MSHNDYTAHSPIHPGACLSDHIGPTVLAIDSALHSATTATPWHLQTAAHCLEQHPAGFQVLVDALQSEKSCWQLYPDPKCATDDNGLVSARDSRAHATLADTDAARGLRARPFPGKGQAYQATHHSHPHPGRPVRRDQQATGATTGVQRRLSIKLDVFLKVSDLRSIRVMFSPQ